MKSFDTNIIVYSINSAIPEHERVRSFLEELSVDDTVVVAEQALTEVYLLVRNPSVFANLYSAAEAVELCRQFRSNSKWKLVDCLPVMEDVWKLAARPGFTRRRIIDARLALTLRGAGVTEFATANVKDFGDFGFDRVWNPLRKTSAR